MVSKGDLVRILAIPDITYEVVPESPWMYSLEPNHKDLGKIAEVELILEGQIRLVDPPWYLRDGDYEIVFTV